jgi:chitin synthase
MQQFAGQDLTAYFPFPLTQACPQLVTDDSVILIPNSTLISDSSAIHNSGSAMQGDTTSALYDIGWYRDIFEPKIKQYYKGALVIEKDDLKQQGQFESRNWAMIDGNVYDLSDYLYTVTTYAGANQYVFLDQQVSGLFQGNPGQDVTEAWNALPLDATTRANNLQCLRNVFLVGQSDVRETARCQVNNYMLLTFTVIICATILVKFLAALQLGTKRSPARQDKYVICQVPAYTEGEDQLRKALDSLTFLNYDDKKKLLFVICDGNITGAGNAGVPTHRIVLDILNSDPKIDPPAFAYKAVAEGMDQLNYAKVFSGLYEFEGHVVPYVVVVKCGRPGEVTRPGNRGKRDSQILLFNFLSRCYFEAPMTPLELEIYHQIANVIGINPRMYEYLLTVDADTEVTEDSLNRLVACCANDSKVIGICGETSLQNEEKSPWTMIQVSQFLNDNTDKRSMNTISVMHSQRHSRVYSAPLLVYRVVSLYIASRRTIAASSRDDRILFPRRLSMNTRTTKSIRYIRRICCISEKIVF